MPGHPHSDMLCYMDNSNTEGVQRSSRPELTPDERAAIDAAIQRYNERAEAASGFIRSCQQRYVGMRSQAALERDLVLLSLVESGPRGTATRIAKYLGCDPANISVHLRRARQHPR